MASDRASSIESLSGRIFQEQSFGIEKAARSKTDVSGL